MDAVTRSASRADAAGCDCRTARRSAFEHNLVAAAISLVAGGRYPEVEVVNIDADGAVDRDRDARAVAGGVSIVPLEAVEGTRGLAVRRR